MNHDYEDIRSRIPEAPKWWDESAVPRYCAFSPREIANIYADEAALVGITCQGCGARFKVAFSTSRSDRMMRAAMRKCPLEEIKDAADSHTLARAITEKTIHYGDPPNAGCCAAGPTMNSEPRRVLEYWRKDNFEWVRDAKFETDIEPDWVEGHELPTRK